MKKIIICGGRDFNDYALFCNVMQKLRMKYNDLHIIHGGARGADTLAQRYADENEIKTKVYCADWNKNGKSAGYVRNALMLEEGKPDAVIAFPGGRGTAHMVKIAKDSKIATWVFE